MSDEDFIMFVCVCSGVTDSMIVEEIHKQKSLNGSVSLSILECQLQMGNTCGACKIAVEDILESCNVIRTNDFLKILSVDLK